MAQRIYLIEDDTALRTELAHVLELSGYAVAAYEGTWGDTAARALAAEPITVPDQVARADGHSICRDIRAKSSVPILMLTSSESEFDEVMAMNLGADDYVTVLSACRAAFLRICRAGAAAQRAVLPHDDLLQRRDAEHGRRHRGIPRTHRRTHAQRAAHPTDAHA